MCFLGAAPNALRLFAGLDTVRDDRNIQGDDKNILAVNAGNKGAKAAQE